MPRIYVSIGSNIDREANIRSGVLDLRGRYPDVMLSGVYESHAVGFDGDDFYNLVAAFDSDEDVNQINAFLHELEQTHGRVRSSSPFSSRTLDMDLLLCGKAIIDDGKIKIPRDEITRYAFVLAPLSELAGDESHPLSGECYKDLWALFTDPDQQIKRIAFPW